MGTAVELKLQLPRRPICATGRVVRNHTLPRAARSLVVNGIRFERMNMRDQDEISRYFYWEVAPRQVAIMRLTQSVQKAVPS